MASNPAQVLRNESAVSELQVDVTFAGAPLAALEEALAPQGIVLVVEKKAAGLTLTGKLKALSRREAVQQLSAMLGAPCEFLGNTLFIGGVPEDEKLSVVYRVPSVPVELLKTVATVPDASVQAVDEQSVLVKASPDVLRRIETALTALRKPGAATVAVKVMLVRHTASADVSMRPLSIDLSAGGAHTILDGVFNFGTKFTSEATSVFSVPRTNVSPQGTVETVGFTEVPIGFKAAVLCRDLGDCCALSLVISDGDALDGKVPPTRSVNTFDVTTAIPFNTPACIGSFAKTGARAGLKLPPLSLKLGGTIQRYYVVVQVQKASAVAEVKK